ncbi:histidinol-phosphate phosphatase [Halobacillus karajensis]|uniref:histidinol-phosphatase HisJ n=1 Tax=Halobacillus karajensis TaxID=195088 RepID=UPI0008A7B17F|nr:histidinol-phosphatase HisJ [Halobacillus karajensis]SEI06370.1 histidinol-phosphate phosphatase [Halobacillus karajensis]
MMDGHIHSPYCPHGTSDSLRNYIEQAIDLGYHSMTFTEHAPLPESFSDPVPEKDSGMSLHMVEKYLQDVQQLKEEYESEIQINKGFEVDFIEGYEREIEGFLDTYGPSLDDSILSVHFLKGQKHWYCIDYSPDMYTEAANDLGGISQLYTAYYKTLVQSVKAELGKYKPTRIGHMTLVKKFQHLYPAPEGWETDAAALLKIVKNYGYALDYNGAGIHKEHCKETYPPLYLARQASSMGIPLVYGSDAHHALGLGQGGHAIDKKLLTL